MSCCKTVKLLLSNSTLSPIRFWAGMVNTASALKSELVKIFHSPAYSAFAYDCQHWCETFFKNVISLPVIRFSCDRSCKDPDFDGHIKLSVISIKIINKLLVRILGYHTVLYKLELWPCRCMSPPTSLVTLYMHLCSDSYNVSREDFEGIL